MRLQLALNVKNIEESISYYSNLFQAEPHKRRPGYANFAIENPPLKLVLFENPNATERINHLGVELTGDEELETVSQRLQENELIDTIENQSTCCFAMQDKVWSTEPQGIRWEWYKILDDNPGSANDPAASGCCT